MKRSLKLTLWFLNKYMFMGALLSVQTLFYFFIKVILYHETKRETLPIFNDRHSVSVLWYIGHLYEKVKPVTNYGNKEKQIDGAYCISAMQHANIGHLQTYNINLQAQITLILCYCF